MLRHVHYYFKTLDSDRMSYYYGSILRNICLNRVYWCSDSKRDVSLLFMFLNSYMFFAVRKDVLRTVLAYLCGTKSFKVFIVLITANVVKSQSEYGPN